MLTNSQRNKIAPISIFFMLYISRLVISMTNIQSVTSGEMRTDMLISIIIAMGLNLTLSLPAIYCSKKNKSPFDVKGLNVFYAVYFSFLAGVNISRFSYFASSVLNPEAPAWIFTVIIFICICYTSRLGIEGIARFSAFAFILIVLTVIAGVGFNIGNFEEINLYPVIYNDTSSILKNVLYITSSSSEMLVFLCLYKRVNGSAVKPYVFSVIAAFLTTFILLLFVIGVMGDGAAMEAFPIYTLFQTAKAGPFQRFDAFHISLWIFGIFLKGILLVYCSSISVKSFKNSTKCIASSVLALCFALAFTELRKVDTMSPMSYVIPYLIACVVIPLLTLMFKKRNSGEELIEKF